MLLIALKMLIGDKAKYIGILVGLCFASFIITQQAAILVGIMKRTYGFVTDTSQPNIWVMNRTVQFIDDNQGMKNSELYRVRGIEGVEWAVPIYKLLVPARLPNGTYQTCICIGIDDATLIGQPPVMLQGSVADLRIDDAIIVNDVGASTKLASTSKDGNTIIPMKVGDTLELNDHRAYVVGICRVSRTFQSQPVIYTTYARATLLAPMQRDQTSFILVKSKDGFQPEELCRMISEQTGLAAYLTSEVKWQTMKYYIKYTGIAINFGLAIILGFIIGTAVAGQTLYNFTIGNLPYFGVLKAMGADQSLLTKMVLLQAFFASVVGWGIGMGAAALMGYLSKNTELSFNMPLYLYFASFASIILICLFVASFCIRRVKTLDPAIVFKS